MSAADSKRPSRTLAFVWVLVAYGVAATAALLAGWALRGSPPLVVAGVADLVGTVVIFGFAVRFDNSSFYDPYWSVAPIFLVVYFTAVGGVAGVRAALIIGLVFAWGLRLTYNWARGWTGLDHEDWRYRDIRGWSGRGYWAASFLTIMLLPTVLVFGGCLSAWVALTAGDAGRPVGILDGVAALVTGVAIFYEATADRQLRRFVLSRPGSDAIMERGLWAYSRHPNYFGEVLFWWGLYLFALAAAPARWWVVGGPAAITALFLCVSIPLIDRRMLARRPGYAAYRARVSRIVPWFPRRAG
jgi:steroid 5-alpha reductase family enzyme